jgi:ABC-type polysaccharide/polyol phosphate export permease
LILALRDLQLIYRQTLLGVAWVVLQPLIAMLIFALVFGRLAKLPSSLLTRRTPGNREFPYICVALTLCNQRLSSSCADDAHSFGQRMSLCNSGHNREERMEIRSTRVSFGKVDGVQSSRD